MDQGIRYTDQAKQEFGQVLEENEPMNRQLADEKEDLLKRMRANGSLFDANKQTLG